MQKVRRQFLIIGAIVIIAITTVIALFLFLNPSKTPSPSITPDSDTRSIVATIYPLAYFSTGILPDSTVSTIVNSGVEPHDFSPTLSDVQKMVNADVFITNGIIDDWAKDVIADRSSAGKTTIIATDTVKIFGDDPHVWLDPVLSQDIVRQIGKTLTALYPTDREAIENGVNTKLITLTGVDGAYERGLETCENREIVTSHSAFGYLARRYNFTVDSIAGISPEDEPSTADLVRLTDVIRSKGITTIFFESLVSSDYAETLARETGAKVDVLDPIESLTSADKEHIGYAGIMNENLQKLRSAMVCQ